MLFLYDPLQIIFTTIYRLFTDRSVHHPQQMNHELDSKM